jgi:hypothetical protein
VLMLDTDFPRPPGDVGNPASWRVPVIFARVAGASVRAAVRDDPGALIDLFAQAGNSLAAQGAVGLVTSCGFLAALQPALATRCLAPVATSSLLQIPMLRSCLRGRVGVVTYDADCLTEGHFLAVGADPATPVIGLPPEGAFHAMIEGGAAYDEAALRAEVVGQARVLQAANPDIAAIVLECTNLPPFSADIAAATGLPVYDVLTLGHWFYAGLTQGARA